MAPALKRGRFWRVLIGFRTLLRGFLGGLGGGVFRGAKLFRQRLVESFKIFDDRCWRVRRGNAIGKSVAAKQPRNQQCNQPIGHVESNFPTATAVTIPTIAYGRRSRADKHQTSSAHWSARASNCRSIGPVAKKRLVQNRHDIGTQGCDQDIAEGMPELPNQKREEGRGWADMKRTTADNTYTGKDGSKRG